MQIVDWVVKQTGKISDNFSSYKFYIKSSPEEQPDSSTMISLTTFTSRDMTATVPCTFRWFKARNNVRTQIVGFRGSTYLCEPSDVGCFIEAQIQSTDEQYPGRAKVRFGPIKFDILLKKQIEFSLAKGQSIYNVDLMQKSLIKECQLKVGQQRITLKHLHSDAVYSYTYSMVEPKIDINPKSPTNLNVVFNERYQDDLKRFLINIFGREELEQEILKNPNLQLNFSSRKCKDSFIFVIKAFNTKKELLNSQIINKIEKIDLSDKDSFEYTYEVQGLKHDILRLLEITNRNYLEKRFYLEENKKMEKQIEEIIASYTRIIEEKFANRPEFEKSLVHLRNTDQQIEQGRLIRLENEDTIKKSPNYDQRMQSHVHKDPVAVPLPFIKKPTPSFQEVEEAPFDTMISNIDNSILREDQAEQLEPPKVRLLEVENQKLRDHQNQSQRQIEELKCQLNSLRGEAVNRSSINAYSHQRKQNPNISDCFLGQEDQDKIKRGHSGLDLSVRLLIKEKSAIEQKYQRLKQKYEEKNPEKKNKSKVVEPSESQLVLGVLDDAKSVKSRNKSHNNESSLLFSQNEDSINQRGQQEHSSNLNLKNTQQNLRKVIEENVELKQKVALLSETIQFKNNEIQVLKRQSNKRIADLSEELEMLKRNSDVMNRSQHVTMEMNEYQEEELQLLKQENSYLKTQNERLQMLSHKYMVDAKKYKVLMIEKERLGDGLPNQ